MADTQSRFLTSFSNGAIRNPFGKEDLFHTTLPAPGSGDYCLLAMKEDCKFDERLVEVVFNLDIQQMCLVRELCENI